MPTAHALLAPSASKRWIACGPSARLEQMMPDKETSYALEGTQAHSIAEKLLTNINIEACEYCPTDEGFQEWKSKINFDQERQACEDLGVSFDEMYETVSTKYVRFVYEDYLRTKQQDPEALLLVEATLKLGEFIPEGFGSSDAVIIGDDTLRVYDLKYGKGVQVSAEQNTQMLCYALGAYYGPCELYDVVNVQMNIIQPRLDTGSSWTIPVESLLTWGNAVLKPAAKRAYNGEGILNSGAHCKFCKASALCPELRNRAIEASTIPADLMTNEELAAALDEAESVEIWLKAVKDYSLRLALDGEKIPGWKVVEGRSLRTIKDQVNAAKELIEAGFSPEDFYRPQELKTITDLEKLLTKKGFQTLLGQYVVKPAGKPTLAPESDKRAEYSPAASDFKDLL